MTGGENMFKEEAKHVWEWLWFEHRGKLLGCLTGILLGLAVILLGFWQALVVTFFAGAGLWLGRAVDNGEDLLGQLKEWRPGGFSKYR